MNTNEFLLTGKNLTPKQILKIARSRGKIKVVLSQDAKENLLLSRKVVQEIASKDQSVYGINTGFGMLAHKKIEKKDLGKLQYNLIRSHCTGVGEFFPPVTARAIMLVRANCLIQGYSGVTPEVVYLLLELIQFCEVFL